MVEIASNAMSSLVEAHIGHIGEDMILSEIDDIKSDYLDIDWTEQFAREFNISHTVININQREDSYKDIFLMSNCKYNIIANSSFRWRVS